MYGTIKAELESTLSEIKSAGLFKVERSLESAQQSVIETDGKSVLNFCANNYLGLSNHPQLVEAAHAALDRFGFGMSSVRFAEESRKSIFQFQVLGLSPTYKADAGHTKSKSIQRRMSGFD